MHKIGIFTDVHGNDAALKVVLEKLSEIGVDEIVSLGDLIAIGPNSNQVLEIVTKLNNFTTIRGNHERYYLQGFFNPLSCTEASHQTWVKESIDPKFSEFLEKTKYWITKEIEGVTISFIHYPMRSLNPDRFEHIVHNPTVENLDILFQNIAGDVVCYGHEHVSSLVQGQKLYLNPGSCGCPYPKKDTTRWMVLTIDKGQVSYNHYEISYDSSSVVKAMYDKEMPDRDFIAHDFYKIKKD